MTPFHPKLRKALLKDVKKNKNKIFKITQNSLNNLKLKGLSEPAFESIKTLENMEYVGQKSFLKAAKRSIGNRKDFKKHIDNIVKYSLITNLIERNILDYERYVTQFYYQQHYAEKRKTSDLLRIFKQADDYRIRNMPNFDKIREKWQKEQQKALMRHNYLLGFDLFRKLAVVALILWLLAAIIYRVVN